ncbi:MAG TPA: response regulator transcription factor [Anaerolineae bacterium]|nr:response regulator transcription factor [Anaerolineae bacterium]
MAQPLILVVEDELSIRKILQTYLESAGFRVVCTADGAAAIPLVRQHQPDLLVLDLNLPGMDGLDIAVRLRQESDIYILMLTARIEEEDRVAGLRLGADDYLTKPFSPRELVARVEAALRRNRRHMNEVGPTVPGHTPLEFKKLTIEPQAHEVVAAGEKLDLTPTEFNVLLVLARNEGLVLTRDQLINQVWGHNFYGNDRVVDVYVGQVRRKLEAVTEEKMINTIRGVGYKFVAEKKRT